MRIVRRQFLSLAAAAAIAPATSVLVRAQEKAAATPAEAPSVFPGAQWEAMHPHRDGMVHRRLGRGEPVL
jgi:hypothetical protein